MTPGHIQCLDYLTDRGEVIVGLLTKRAMNGYKKEIVPFKDRKFILESLWTSINFIVIPQYSLNPYTNLKKYNCTHIASGDGWEPIEEAAMQKASVIPIIIKLKNERKKRYSSSVYLQHASKRNL